MKFSISNIYFVKIVKSLILFLISILLYVFSPKEYSYNYCLILLAVFLILSYSIVKSTVINNNYFTFHVLFLISFFFVNFVYPIFQYPYNQIPYVVFKHYFNHSLITKTTALSVLGISSYNVGVNLSNVKYKSNSSNNLVKFNTYEFLITNWLYFVFGLILIIAGKEIMRGNMGSTQLIPPGLLVIFQVSIGLAIIIGMLSSIYSGGIINFFVKYNKPILFLTLFSMFLFAYAGDRGPSIQVVMIFVGAYSLFIKPIKLKSLALLVLLGMFTLSFLQGTRTHDVSKSGGGGFINFIERGIENYEVNNFIDIGKDLIVNNRNLYAGYDYAKNNGYTYGSNMFNYLFAPIPFLPSLMTNIFFDSPPSQLTTARILTDEVGVNYGLGTNMVADLFMAFGIFGVIVFLFLLGFIVTKAQIKANQNSISASIIYIFLIGFSIYLPRTSILDPFRHIVWALILYFVIKYIRLFLIQYKLSLKKYNE